MSDQENTSNQQVFNNWLKQHSADHFKEKPFLSMSYFMTTALLKGYTDRANYTEVPKFVGKECVDMEEALHFYNSPQAFLDTM